MNGLDTIRSVLVLRTDKVGDLILSTPAIRCLREALPEARITLVATPYNAPVVQGSPRLDEVLLLYPEWPPARKIRFALEVRSRRFDMAVVLSPRTPAYLLGWISGAPIRAGIVYSSRVLPRACSPLMLTHAHIPDRCESTHEVRQMLDLLGRLGIPTDEHPLEVYPTADDRAWANDRLPDGGPLIGLHLSAKWTTDGWSPDDLLRLMRLIPDGIPGASVVATRGIHDGITAEPLADRLSQSDPDDRVRVISDMEFGQWASVLERCDAVISPDTGSLHLAAAAGKPVVALYSARTFDHCSVQWAPWKVPNRVHALGSAEATTPAIVDSVRNLLTCRTEPTASPTPPRQFCSSEICRKA